MKRETDVIIASTAFVLLFGLVSSLLIQHRPVELTQEAWHGSWACAADTLQCPDGTSVGRVPPYCLFAECSAQ
jgi:hypothetical protein